MEEQQSNILIYNIPDGKASVRLMSKKRNAWMNFGQSAELFDTSAPCISTCI